MLERRPVLFLMIEEGFAQYFFTALARAALGRRTVGLLFRPKPTLGRRTWRHRVKFRALAALRRVAAARTLSIVPAPLVPGLDRITDGWIHDFQLWDIGAAERRRLAEITQEGEASDAGALYAEVRRRAAGCKVLVSLGYQTRQKGFGHLASAIGCDGIEGWFVLVLGQVAPDQQEAKRIIEAAGALVIDGYASDEEVYAAYAVADAVWCHYDESYDQASGILGRAAQFGVPAVVRKGSLMADLCVAEGLQHASLECPHQLADALPLLPPPDPEVGARLSARLRAPNLERLRNELGLDLPEAEALECTAP